MKRHIILLLLAFGPALVALGKTWTLQECIDYALANNITLQQQRLSTAQSDADVKASKAAMLPSLSLSTNQTGSFRPFSQSTIDLTNGTMTTSSSEVNYNGNYGINANWTVWDGGQNLKNIKRSKMSRKITEFNSQSTANSIQEQIAQLYIQILYEAEAVKVDSEIVKFSILQRDRAKEMVKVGKLARVDLIQLEAQVTRDQYQLVSAQAQLDRYKLQLKQLLEITGNVEFNVATPEIDDSAVLTAVPNAQNTYQAALGFRPEIQSGKLGVEASKMDEQIAKTGYYPTVRMIGNLATNNSGSIHKSFGTQVKNNWSNSLGVAVSVPIFDQKQTKTKVVKARLATQDSELQLEDARKKLYSTIEDYYLNATTAQQQFAYAKANVESMQQSYDLVSEQFRLGLKNIIELTTGKNNLLEARQQLLQTKYTALLNISMLKFYQGQPIIL